jgi:MYXO-CTERM domain-containing protein
MGALYRPGSIHLTADDVAGICAAYPPKSGTASSGGCACTTAAAEPEGAAPAAILAGILGVSWGFRRSRSERERP